MQTPPDTPSPAAAAPLRFDELVEHIWRIDPTQPEESLRLLDDLRTMVEDGVVSGQRDLALVGLTELMVNQQRGASGVSVEKAIGFEAALRDQADVLWRAHANRRIAISLMAHGEPTRSIAFAQLAVDLFRDAGELALTARCLASLATAYQESGMYPSAIESYREARAMSEATGDAVGLGFTLNNLANVHLMLGEQAQAIELYESARAIAATHRLKRLAGLATMNLAIVMSDIEDYERSFALYSEALSLDLASGDESGACLVLQNLASLSVRRHDDRQALEYLAQCIEIARRLDARSSLMGALLISAGIAMRAGERDAAMESIAEAEAIAGELDSDDRRTRLYEELHRIYFDAGMYREAYENLREYHRIDREVRTNESHRRILEIEAARELEIERIRSVELAGALAQLKSAQTRLVHAEKMSSLAQLTAGIAHEINNPVGYIRASISPLRRDLDQLLDGGLESVERDELRSEIGDLLRGIEAGATRTTDLVTSLRSFSRLDEDDFKQVDLRQGIESVLSLLGRRLDGRIDVRRELDAVPEIECRPGQINQVIMGVLSNAIDAIEGPGAVVIGLRHEGASVVLSIGDSGRGISSDDLPRIFEPFFTRKEVGSGQGLGLAIAHTIIAEHHGSIEVTETSERGTTVTIRLPVSHQVAVDER